MGAGGGAEAITHFENKGSGAWKSVFQLLFLSPPASSHLTFWPAAFHHQPQTCHVSTLNLPDSQALTGLNFVNFSKMNSLISRLMALDALSKYFYFSYFSLLPSFSNIFPYFSLFYYFTQEHSLVQSVYWRMLIIVNSSSTYILGLIVNYKVLISTKRLSIRI